MSARQVVGTALLVVAAVGCGGAGSGPVSSGGSKGVETSTFKLTVRGEIAVLDPSTSTTIILPGGGLITSSSGGIDCGMVGGTLHKVCSAKFPYGTTGIVLTATPDTASGYQYYGFAGACGLGTCSVDITSDRLVVVRFGKTQAGLGAHPNFTDPAVHGPLYRDFAAGAAGALNCTSCHGASLQGQGIACGCAACHALVSPTTYLLGGSISGLTGAGLILGTAGEPPLSVPARTTTYAFGNAVSGGTAYQVSILSQPAGQTCSVTNGAGSVASDDVANIAVSCGPVAFHSVAGSVTGLVGTGLVLLDNGGDALPVSSSGTFTFATGLAPGSAYSVTVAQQPTNPAQTCAVTDGVGIVGSSDVSSVWVACTTNTYLVGGTISGLLGDGLVLTMLNGPSVAIKVGATTFTIPSDVASGTAYAVSVFAQPSLETCTVSNAIGTVTSADVTDVAVGCTCNSGYVDVGGACALANQSRSCTVSNGTGAQTSTDGGQTWSACVTAACNSSYTLLGGACVLTNQTQACTVTNGTGTETSTNGGVSWSACVATACNSGYTLSGGACILIAPVSVTVSPSESAATVGGVTNFSATVTGGSGAGGVTWSVRESGGGSVTSTGIYTAPPTPGIYHLDATSTADSTKTGTATILVSRVLLGTPAIYQANTLSPNTSAVFSGGAPLVAADFDGDGILDLAICNGGYDTALALNHIAVRRGAGDGTFGPAAVYATGPISMGNPYEGLYPRVIRAGDLNGDGHKDIVVGYQGTSDFSAMLGGTSGLAPPVLGGGPYVDSQEEGIAVGDVNGDGKLDVLRVGLNYTRLSVMLGTGAGTFQAGASYSLAAAAGGIALGDFNRDGKVDAAVSLIGGHVAVFLGNGDGTFRAPATYSLDASQDQTGSLTIADMNGDGAPDIVVVSGTSTVGDNGSVSVLLNAGDGTFTLKSTQSLGAQRTPPGEVAVADFTGDGVPDVIVADGWYRLLIFPGHGDGSLWPSLPFSLDLGAYNIAVGDYNRDGKPDVAVVTQNSSTRLYEIMVLAGQ
jgi:hypothetical protein